MSQDPDLRERFASLRDEEGVRIPAFEQVLRRARRKSTSTAFAIATSLVVAVVAASVFEISRNSTPRGADIAVAVTLGNWRAPTDFLLDTPGRELLHAVPEVGEYPGYGLVPLPKLPPTNPAQSAAREPT